MEDQVREFNSESSDRIEFLMGCGGKGRSRGRHSAKRFNKDSCFQVQLKGHWSDYDRQEDMLMKRAFLVGQKNVRYTFRDSTYEYDFKNMQQLNVHTGKRRDIRPPMGMRAPKKPLLPPGPMICITVPPGAAGTIIEVSNPNDPGKKIQVSVPPSAKPGQKMAIPIPEKGEKVEAVQKKQAAMSTGAKVAAGTAGVGLVAAAVVGGVVLGDHLAGGDMAETVGETAVDVTETIGESAVDGAEDVADWVADTAPDALDALDDGAGDVAGWVGDAAEDVGDWLGDAGVDVADWLGDAAEDVGDFVMDLF